MLARGIQFCLGLKEGKIWERDWRAAHLQYGGDSTQLQPATVPRLFSSLFLIRAVKVCFQPNLKIVQAPNRTANSQCGSKLCQFLSPGLEVQGIKLDAGSVS